MPSLRRTASNPTVRASPYHYPSNLAAGGTSAANATGTATRLRRACSGAEPSSGRRGRVVLADIEWWRVLDGQQPEPEDEESGDDVNANANNVDEEDAAHGGFEVDVDQGTAVLGGAVGADDDAATTAGMMIWDAAGAREPGVSVLSHLVSSFLPSSFLRLFPSRLD